MLYNCSLCQPVGQKKRRFMNHCSRCNKPCAPGAVLCDECQNQLRGQFRHIPFTSSSGRMSASPQNQRLPGGNVTQPHIAVLPEQREAFADPSTPITNSQPVVGQAQGAHGAPQASYVNSTEQVIDRLSEAAQRIAEEEQPESLLHKRPRASRLAPLRDISADIRRDC